MILFGGWKQYSTCATGSFALESFDWEKNLSFLTS
jgi:hypothetical protein